MKRFFKWACILLTSMSATVVGADTTITFDDLPTTSSGSAGNWDLIPTSYNLFQWGNFAVYNPTVSSGYKAGVISPNNVAFNNLAGIATISSSNSFNLLSAHLTAAWRDNLIVTVTGYKTNTAIYSSNYTVSATAPTLVYFNFYGVTSVGFSSDGGTAHSGYILSGYQFAMDNLTFNTGSVFTITLTATNGSATANPTAGTASSTTALTATNPAPGYTFSSWMVTSAGGGSISSTTANPTTFTFGSGNAAVTANFVEMRRVTSELADVERALAEAEDAWLQLEEQAP